MPVPRKALVSVETTPSYHVVSRCVRRTFLCGTFENKDFSHRRGWIEERLAEVAAVFSIAVSSYAIMSNHYHLVVRIQRQPAKDWGILEVIRRWNCLFQLPLMIERYLNEEPMSEAELDYVRTKVALWRERLVDLSWFMRCLNEKIARLANAEDGCTGHFWEGRFKSQAILNDVAELQVMAYVDLNPIRATMADTLEGSDYTSIQARLCSNSTSPMKKLLIPFAGNSHRDNHPHHIPYNLVEYIQLVEWTGRQIHSQKRGAISDTIPPLFARLKLSHHVWLRNCRQLETIYHRVIGPAADIQKFCELLNQKWLRGLTPCREAFG
jgi:putative transposase